MSRVSIPRSLMNFSSFGRWRDFVNRSAGKQANWMTSWYFKLDQYYNLPVTLHCDNRAAKALAETTTAHSKIKHVAMKSHWIREAVEHKEIKIATCLILE